MKTAIQIATLVFILSLSISCDKTKYELHDPEEAGVWTLFDTATGLPSNQVEGIALDRENNLWVTFPSNGAARLSNGTWTIYRTSNSEILSNSVTAVASDSGGAIIIGTTDGISILSANDQWTSYRDPEASAMFINCIKVTRAGHIYVGTPDRGLYINAGSGFTRLDENSFPDVRAIEEDRNNNVFVGTGNGIRKWNGSSWSSITTASGLPSNKVTALRADRKNRMWVGTADGLKAAYIDASGVRQISLMAGATETHVTDIFEDRRGHVWFSTLGKGLIRYDGVIPHSYKVYNGFFEDVINCIGEDDDGNLWFGLNSKGLVRYTLPLN
jgi:ligand-binding sensor domain-containing protein